jgi:hypothetical protein
MSLPHVHCLVSCLPTNALASVVLPMDVCTFRFWLIGVESPSPERKDRCLLRGLNPGQFEDPTANRILISEQQQGGRVGSKDTFARQDGRFDKSQQKLSLTQLPSLSRSRVSALFDPFLFCGLGECCCRSRERAGTWMGTVGRAVSPICDTRRGVFLCCGE